MKALKILLVILLTLIVIAGTAYLVYEPEDYCYTAEFTERQYKELSSKLDMTYNEYMSLGQMNQLRLLKENLEYTKMKVAYEMNIEAKQLCIAYMGMSKFNRLEIDVYSRNYFDD